MQLKRYPCLILLILLAGIFQFNPTNAQCTGRYLDTVFTSIDSTMNVVYTDSAGGNTQQLLDIYQPVGDTACLRHVVIFVHGGAFFKGTKNDGDVEFLCQRFAQRGYVAASINYRLASSVVALYDSAQIFTYVMKAVSDLKAAIRFFYKDASHTNQWNIDTNSFFIGGSSAGAIAADYVGLVDSVAELAAPFQTICNAQGGINGNSGNTGYSAKIIAVASLAGAVDRLSYIKPSSPPMVFCQGTADGTIPYDCGDALTQYTGGLYYTIHFCGSGEMSPALTSAGVSNSLMPFPGSGHVPWDTNVVIQNRMDSSVAAFFYQVKCTQAVCTGPSGIAPISNQSWVNVYPNPATGVLHISVNGLNQLADITLYDCTGRQVRQQYSAGTQATLPIEGLSGGFYILRLNFKDALTGPFSERIVVE